MAEALGTMHKRRRGLLQGWWWPVGPKSVFDQIAPILEIMNMSGNLPTLSTPHLSHNYHHHNSSYAKYLYFHSSLLHISHKLEILGQKHMSRHFLEILQVRFKPHMKQRLQWTDADQTKWIMHFQCTSNYLNMLKVFGYETKWRNTISLLCSLLLASSFKAVMHPQTFKCTWYILAKLQERLVFQALTATAQC
jgi:hypothetical protein